MGAYDSAIALAKRLITKKGAAISLRRYTDGTPADPAKPWQPGARTHVDYPTHGAFLEYQKNDIDGTEVKAGDQQVYVAASDLAVAPAGSDVILRGSEVWTIKNISELKPADDPVLYVFQVRQ